MVEEALLNDEKHVFVRAKRKSYQSPLEAFWFKTNEREVKRPLLDFEKLSINDLASKEAVSSSTTMLKDDKPVIVRVKRKGYQSPLEAFWLEINVRQVKRPLLDFEKLSINNSASKAEELKSKKFFVQHLDTVSCSDVAVEVLQSFVASKPNSADGLADLLNSKAKLEDQRRSNRTRNKQKRLRVKAKETQELLAKNACIKQIWKSRKGTDTAASDDALHDMCRLYDVERVDAVETSEVHDQEDEKDLSLVHPFLSLIQEFVPSAAEEIKIASKDDYVYDLYAVKDDIGMMEESESSAFPFVHVDDIDDFYDGPDNSSDCATDDSNAEDNCLNDYPDEKDGQYLSKDYMLMNGDEDYEDEDDDDDES